MFIIIKYLRCDYILCKKVNCELFKHKKMASYMLLEEALLEERLERRRNRRRLREALNVNALPDIEFVANYRLSRVLFEELCQEIVPLLPRKRNRRGIDPATKVFFIVFYRTKIIVTIMNIFDIIKLILDFGCSELLRSG